VRGSEGGEAGERGEGGLHENQPRVGGASHASNTIALIFRKKPGREGVVVGCRERRGGEGDGESSEE
jgi:hypothetical protein